MGVGWHAAGPADRPTDGGGAGPPLNPRRQPPAGRQRGGPMAWEGRAHSLLPSIGRRAAGGQRGARRGAGCVGRTGLTGRTGAAEDRRQGSAWRRMAAPFLRLLLLLLLLLLVLLLVLVLVLVLFRIVLVLELPPIAPTPAPAREAIGIDDRYSVGSDGDLSSPRRTILRRTEYAHERESEPGVPGCRRAPHQVDAGGPPRLRCPR